MIVDESFMGAIESTVRRILYNEVSTFMPGEIVKVNREGSALLVDVKSSFLLYDTIEGKNIERTINSVPLMFYRSGGMILRPPTDNQWLIGESVGLVISQNYLANWQNNGGLVLPTDGRKFHIADAVAQFGLYPDVKPWPTQQKENTAELKVKDGVKLEIGNSQADIPLILAEIGDILSTAASTTGGGPLVLQPSSISGKTLAQLIQAMATLYNQPV